MRAMLRMGISFGQTASHSASFVQLPKPSSSMRSTMRRARRRRVDQEPAGAADPLAAVVVEGDRVLAPEDELLVERVEHLEEGHVRRDAVDLVVDEAAGARAVLLPPDGEPDLHLGAHAT